MKEALFYTLQENNSVQCRLCPHECTISEGHIGICRVRENIDGKLIAQTYNKISSFAMDPIEKKPLRRYKNGAYILSVGTMGCNFTCDNCQNYHISQKTPLLKEMTAQQLIALSNEHEESIGIAFTYNEPMIWYEYVYEVAQNNNKDTVLVTNGYINKAPLEQLLPYIDAMNIDIKSMNPRFYQEVCGGTLDAVQNTIMIAQEKTHVELTFLAIPGRNDTVDEMKALSKWIADINKDIALHIIPFRPMYQMTNVLPQSMYTIAKLKDIAREELQYVY